MNGRNNSSIHFVKIMTLLCLLLLVGCSYISRHYKETCNFRAYLRTPLNSYLTTRYHSKAPVRLAVIPFSVPANLAVKSNEFPGIGNEIAWKLKDELLVSGEVPIVEILNRQDWPRKKEEYHTGNYGAIAMGIQAGYDLVLVGKVENLNTLNVLKAKTKIIEVRTGITIWNGESTVQSDRKSYERFKAWWGADTRRPDKLYMNEITDKLAECIKTAILQDEIVP